MKAVSKLMAELEDEVRKYASEGDTKKYANIRNRLINITKEMKVQQPTSQANIVLRVKYKERLTQLWKDFKSWSEFHVTSKTRTQVEVYLKGKMD